MVFIVNSRLKYQMGDLKRYAENMEFIGNIIFLSFSITCLLLTLWHESRWLKRRKWLKTKGRVIEIVSSGADDDPHPKIEYKMNDTIQNFVSDYGGSSCPVVGESVIVLYEPESNQAEHFTQTNRWLFTIIPFLFFAGFAYFALFTE